MLVHFFGFVFGGLLPLGRLFFGKREKGQCNPANNKLLNKKERLPRWQSWQCSKGGHQFHASPKIISIFRAPKTNPKLALVLVLTPFFWRLRVFQTLQSRSSLARPGRGHVSTQNIGTRAKRGLRGLEAVQNNC